MNSPFYRSTRTGLTLIELVVALGLFAIVMTLCTGAYLTVSAANRQAQALATATNSLSFVLENMTRSIRTGSQFSCGAALGAGDCVNGGTAFTFVDSSSPPLTTTYTVPSGQTYITRQVLGSPADVLTNLAVTVSSLKFYVDGTSKVDSKAPTVRIVIIGTIKGAKSNIPFTIETSATMRGTDI